MLLVHMGSPEEGELFFDERWLEARAVSDEAKELYAGFGLARGTFGQLMGPRAIWACLRSVLKGHGLGKPVGDPLMLSGWFLVHGDAVLWQHVHEHSGVARRLDQVARVWTEERAAARPSG